VVTKPLVKNRELVLHVATAVSQFPLPVKRQQQQTKGKEQKLLQSGRNKKGKKMVKIECTTAIRTKRALGIWPQGAIEPLEDCSLLEKSLQLEYLLGSNNARFNPLEERSPEVEALLGDTLTLLDQCSDHSVEKLVNEANCAHMLILQGEFERGYKLLDTTHKPTDSYDQGVLYKKFFLASIVFRFLGDAVKEKNALIDAVNAFTTVPVASHIEANKWLNLCYDRFFGLDPTATVEGLHRVFKNKNFVISYFNHLSSRGIKFQATIEDLKNYILKRAESLISSTKFPKATESNNHELEEFVDLASKSCALSSSQLKDITERAIAKTYQSHIILRSLIRVFISEKKTTELQAAVEVYDSYIQAYCEQNEHQYRDIISIIQINKLLLDQRLDNKSHLQPEDYAYYSERTLRLKNLLNEFYNDQGIERVSEFDMAEVLVKGHPKTLDESLASQISEVWSTIANMSWILLNHEEFNYTESKSAVDGILETFRLSIWLSPQNDTVFQYAKTLATLRNIKGAYGVLKVLLKELPKTSPLYFQSWHLLSLILSVEENKDEAFKVIGFLMSEISDFIETSTASATLRDTFIQAKITQLAIIEALFGVEQSLDSLPELFELFHTLYLEFIELDGSRTPVAPEKGHKRSLSLARTQTIQKIKSIRHKEHKSEPEPNPKKAQITIRANFPSVKKTLQDIWLIAAQIYFKLNLFTEAEEAIIEAENSFKPTPDSHLALALLISKKRPTLSMKEMDTALMLGRHDIAPVVGFASLVLNSDESVFVSEKDRLSAITRAKILLEGISDTFQGAQTTEVWWLLSNIYEMFKDPRLKDALWKSVELEETRPVRRFEFT
jgi:tetratricopeptide (TPR) repeat protein